MTFVYKKCEHDCDSDYNTFTLTYNDENQKINFHCDFEYIDKPKWIELVDSMNNNSTYNLSFDTVNGNLSISTENGRVTLCVGNYNGNDLGSLSVTVNNSKIIDAINDVIKNSN
jgi:hypothetical protein